MRKNGGEGPPSSTLRTTRGLERRRSPDVATLAIGLSADRPREAGALFVVPDGGVTIGRGTGPALVEGRLAIADGRMSTSHARVAFEGDELVLTDLGSTNGSRVNGVTVERATLRDGDVIELGYTFFVTRTTTLAMVRAAEELQLVRTFSPTFASELARLARIARSELPVMLNGPTGTGKEVLARAIHAASGRPGPFVAVNCGALPATLIEAQLFGHTRGAFTGAVRDSRGFVRAAEHGTLLLDEVGELPAESQAALLRVLEEGEVVPVGSTTPEPVDVRIVSATHQRLDAAMEAGRFRPDLYARLAGFVHELPALATRREDLGILIATFLDRHGARPEVRLRSDAARALFAYDFPLNVRELEHAITAAITLAEDDVIGLDALPDAIAHPRAAAPGSEQQRASVRPSTLSKPPQSLSAEDATLRDELVRHLAETSGNVTEVGRRMGKARQQVQRWMRRFGLEAK